MSHNQIKLKTCKLNLVSSSAQKQKIPEAASKNILKLKINTVQVSCTDYGRAEGQLQTTTKQSE